MPIPQPKEYRKIVENSNLGLYLDRPPMQIPDRGMAACNNVRIQEGRVKNRNMGWETLPGMSTPLNGQVILIEKFKRRDGASTTIFGTPLDLYQYDAVNEVPLFITPTFTSVDMSGTVTVGAGTKALDFSTTFTDDDDIAVGDFIAFGAADENDPTVTWYEIDWVDGANTDATVTVAHVAGVTDVAFTVRQVFDGGDGDIWSSAIFPYAQPDNEDLWYATNGTMVVKWNGSDDFAENVQGRGETNLGFTCKGIQYWKNMMLYFDVTDGGVYKPGVVKNSDTATPEEMADGDAAEVAVGDGLGPIRRLKGLGDVVCAYSGGDGSIDLLQWVGGSLKWVMRTAVPRVPILSSRSLVSQGDYHDFLGLFHAYRFDGVQLAVTAAHVMREVLRAVDIERRVKALAWIDRQNAEVIAVVPKTSDSTGTFGGPKTAYVAHYLEPVGSKPVPMTMRDLPATAIGEFERSGRLKFSDLTDVEFQKYNYKWNDSFFATEFPMILFGDEDGYVYVLNALDTKDGSSLLSYARFPRFRLADGRHHGVARRLELFTGRRTEGDSFTTTMIGYDHYDAPHLVGSYRSSTNAWDLTMDNAEPWVNPRLKARFAQVQVDSSGRTPWEMSGYSVESSEAGVRI